MTPVATVVMPRLFAAAVPLNAVPNHAPPPGTPPAAHGEMPLTARVAMIARNQIGAPVGFG
jgi:hypothetical protein